MSLVIIVIGASGIIAQIVLIRELLVNFQGNELSIGIILSNWLITEALGSYLFRKTNIKKQSYKNIILVFSFIFPNLCILARIIRPLAGLIIGEIATLPIIFIASFIILLPVGFLHGGLFTLSASLMSNQQLTDPKKIPGLVYIFENLGTIIGGLVISFLLIPLFNSIQIACLIAMLNLISISFLTYPKISKSIFFYSTAILLFGVLFILSGKIEHWTLTKNYPNYTVLSSRNTVYGNITTIKREEQYTFLVDNIPTIQAPDPDQTFIEDIVHFPLLTHPNPKKILLISGGAGGIIQEMLKHPVQEIYYLELDPNLIRTVKTFSTRLTEQELSDPKVKLIYQDGRSFLTKDTEKFDLIFVNFTYAPSLQTNRYFTREFYQTCKNKLNATGLLVTLSFGSLTYLSPILSNIISIHTNTLHAEFPYTKIIPGDFFLYLSSIDPNLEKITADTLSNRLHQRKISSTLFNSDYIKYRTNQYYLDWLYLTLSKNNNRLQKKINQDGLPLGLSYNLTYRNTIANSSLSKIFLIINQINIYSLLIFLIIISAILFFVTNKHNRSIYLPFAIFTTGFTAMLLSLILSLGFQIRYGYLYYQISILLTTFIVGSAFGGYLGNNYFPNKLKSFRLIEILIIILLLALLLSSRNRSYPVIFNNHLDFYLFLFIAGLLAGIQFPLANRIIQQSPISNIVGKLYAADLFGGCIAAIIVSVVLVPSIGIFQTIVFAIALKTISACLLLTAHAFSIE